jgi:large subunit ribosomal protein L4
LSKKQKDKEVLVLEALELKEGKTKTLYKVLKLLPMERQSAIIGLANHDENAARAARNIPQVKVMTASNFNVIDLLSHKYVVVVQDALGVLQNTFVK